MPDPTRTVDHTDAAAVDGAATTATDGLIRESAETLPPVTTGRYLLGDEIARGGMGAVYRATDTVLNREVAIKVLQERFAPNSPTAARFFDEARITAQLQHPAIPPVHDLGTLPDGRPFLAMKLIHGQTLEALLKPVHQVDTRPSPNLVAVFEQICLALAFAHSRGIIHRDLKPANVMVGAFGEVQVMDWGLARETRNRERGTRKENPEPNLSSLPHSDFPTPNTDHTVAGSAIGTPAFMPPEQARGELELIDSRSDVFGLGAILCAILTQQPPYTKTGLAALRQAGNAELHDAFTRLDAAPAEPELIALCKHCLNPKPQDRPADAGLVAKAVSQLRTASEERARHAELERVKAETEAHAQQRRRRLQLALAAAAMLLIAAGGAFAWWQDKQKTAQARDAKERTERNAEALHALLTRCEHSLRQNNADDAAAALAEIERRLPEGGDGPLTERIQRSYTDLKLLQHLNEVDQFYWSLRGTRQPSGTEVVSRLQAAFESVNLVPGSRPVAEIAAELNRSQIRDRALGALELWHWVTTEPPALREVLQTADPDPFREAVREARRTTDGSKGAELAQRPEALRQPAWFASVLGHQSAIPVTRRRQILEEALRAQPGNLTLLMIMTLTYPFNQAAGAAERLRWSQAAVSTHPRNLSARQSRAMALVDLGDLEQAMVEYREILRLDPNFTVAAGNYAVVLGFAKRYEEAIAVCREAIRRNPGDNWCHEVLGDSLYLHHEYAAAIAAYEESIRLYPGSSKAHVGLSAAHVELKQYDQAIAAAREAIRLGPAYAPGQAALGIALTWKGNVDDALAAFREAIRLDPNYALPHANLGGLLTGRGEFEGAEAACKEAIRIAPRDAFGHAKLAQVYLQQNKFKAAANAARTAVSLDPQVADSYGVLATALVQLKDHVGAREAFAKLKELEPKHQLLFMSAFLEKYVAPPPREVQR